MTASSSTRPRKNAPLVAAVLVALGLVAAACGSGGDGGDAGDAAGGSASGSEAGGAAGEALVEPGAYPVEAGMTLLQALSLAGGVTDKGAAGRTKVIRDLKGKKTELKLKLTDLVQPGDTIVVPDRFF